MSRTGRTDLAGKAVIVTGGANGIGRATCRAFVDEGARVVIADVDERAGATLAEELSQGGEGDGDAIFVPTDVSNESQVAEMVARTVSAFAAVDILVNGAAEFIMRGIDASVEDWQRIMSVNIMGYALCAREVIREMRPRRRGAIVNIASVSSFIAQPGLLTYSTTKAAVANMTRCMALELAPHGIRVNAVCPGTVWTDRTESFVRHTYGLDRRQADAHPEIGGVHMLGRTADPEEIARAILFLASDDASFITAENLMVDGGYGVS